jgi:hypothetical protein
MFRLTEGEIRRISVQVFAPSEVVRRVAQAQVTKIITMISPQSKEKREEIQAWVDERFGSDNQFNTSLLFEFLDWIIEKEKEVG